MAQNTALRVFQVHSPEMEGEKLSFLRMDRVPRR